MKTFITFLIATLTMAISTQAFAVQINNSSNKVLGQASVIKCGAGLTCTMGTTASGPQAAITVSGGAGSFTSITDSGTLAVTGASTLTGGVALPAAGGAMTTFIPFPVAATTGVGTSTAGVATSVFLTQLFIDQNATITGIAVNNAATVGTNKWIVAIFNAAGTPLANSALAGVTTSGASAWQKVNFTAPVNLVGPSVYYIGVYMNGATDNFFTIPAAGAFIGNAGTVAGQTFGTVAAVTPPATFTAGAGPIVYTY